MSKKNDSKPKEAELMGALNNISVNQEKMTASLQELVKWVKVTSHSEVGKILIEQVQSNAQKIVYQNSDGEKSTKELFELSGMYPADISENWKKWTRVGIAEQVSAQGGSRGRRLFSLEEFGIELPKAKSNKIINEEKPTKTKTLNQENQA